MMTLWLGSCSVSEPDHGRFFVYYGGSTAWMKTPMLYDWGVVEPEGLEELPKDLPMKVAGYISMGQVTQNRGYLDELDEKGCLLFRDTVWKGYQIDVRCPVWKSLLVDKLVPELAAKGFQGIFWDNLQEIWELEDKDAVKYKGSRDSVKSILRELHAKFPEMRFVFNRGWDFIEPAMAPYIYLLVESYNTTYDFKNETYVSVSPEDKKYLDAKLDALHRRYPDVPVWILDYAPTDSAVREEYGFCGKPQWWCYKTDILLRSLP